MTRQSALEIVYWKLEAGREAGGGGWVTSCRPQIFALKACSVDKINTVPELQFSFPEKKKDSTNYINDYYVN